MASGMGDLIKWGAIGVGAYWIYTNYFTGAVPAATTGTTTAPAATTTAATPNPNAITGANTLDGIYSRMIAAAAAPAAGLAVDSWDFFLNQILSPLGKTAPDPMPIFTAAVSGFDRSQLLTGAQYWAVLAPALKTQLGLSGLGCFAGLGRLYGFGGRV